MYSRTTESVDTAARFSPARVIVLILSLCTALLSIQVDVSLRAGMANDSSGFIDLVGSGHHTCDDGVRIYYELHGSGPQKVVFLQGS